MMVKKVSELYYEADEESATETLNQVRRKILSEKSGVKELYLHHVVDTLKPGEETVCVVAAGSHRNDAFDAARQALEELKLKPRIWKKEITEKNTHWVSEQ
ncbi:MAG: molybdenum cofactor biosynthesis protein MoaE [Candidatus Bathyarchaeota archaeon]